MTDNGSSIIAAVRRLSDKYGIHHIKISAYNSRANGVIERRHRDVRESLAKLCGPSMRRWPATLPAVAWAERTTILKSVGISPFEIATGVEPVFPFDLAEATWLRPPRQPMNTSELIATRARQLQKRDADLELLRRRIGESRQAAVDQLTKNIRESLRDFVLEPGDLALVRNSAVENSMDSKAKDKYFGPYLVVKQHRNGNYTLSELDGSVMKKRLAESRIIPYYPRTRVPVTEVQLQWPMTGDGSQADEK